ncbi:MAG: UUP1 family membrane protein [Pseudomonadota bacterium]
MLRSAQVAVVVAALAAFGLSIFAYKVIGLHFPLLPEKTTDYWDIEAKISFEGRGDAARIKIARVQDTAYQAVLQESYLTPSGFGVRKTRVSGETDKFAAFERRRLGTRAILFYRAVLVDLDSSDRRAGDKPEAVSDYDAAARDAAARTEQTPFLFALDEIIDDAENKSATQQGFLEQLILISADAEDPRIQALRAGGPPRIDEPARRLSVILNAADVPARRVEGLLLEDNARDVPVRRWVDVWFNNRWRPLDPETGEWMDPAQLAPLSTGDRPLVQYSGVNDVYVSYAVARRPQDAITEALRRADAQAPLLAALSLRSLPQHTQQVFEVILLIPVGALIIAVFRQLVGLPSFGTFMPVLIALSFRETSLLRGLVLFVGIVLLGLGLRSYFNRLQLLVVPRLSAMLTIVTLLMACLALIGAALEAPVGLSVSLFPLVIITMTIERMSLVWDEYGAKEALVQGAGSLVAAIVGYFIISNDFVEHYAFTFPELLLVVLAALIGLGRYNGYKLSEYFRFRSLADGA